MIVLHLLQLNDSVNYYRKWKLISSEVGVKLKIGKIQNSVKSKIVVQIYWTHVRPPAGDPVMMYSESDTLLEIEFDKIGDAMTGY